jgi:pectate lyase-like protein
MDRGRVCNAREHGLKGDGRTNDQPALAALVEELGRACKADALPRVIYCPPGAYRIAGATTAWRSGVSLTGAGEGATRFILESDGEAVALAGFTRQQHGASRENPLADCMFFNFEIDGSRVRLDEYDPRAKGLDLQYMVRATFRDLYIHDVAATGLGCDHLNDSVLEGVYAMRCGRLNNGEQPGGAGIGIGVGGWEGIERANITDCIAHGNATNGVFFELQKDMWPPPRGLKILGCHCTGNRFGISDWGADGLIVANCLMLENRESGFDVSLRGTAGVAGRGGLLSGCVVDANGKDGVCFDGTPGPYTIRGCRISNNRRHGYWHWRMRQEEDAPREIVLEGNDIFGNAGYGVRFEREALDVCLMTNRIRRNGAGALAFEAPMPGLWREGNREDWSGRG